MANICITTVCNRDCSYCFSQHDAGAPPFMNIDQYRQSLTFLKRSGIQQIRILGGEPTLHPGFKEIMALALETGQRIQLFSNGLMRENTLNLLADLSPEILTVILNVTPTPQETANEKTRRRSVLKRLGSRAVLSFTIYRPDIALDDLLDLVRESSAQRRIRLGLALPCLYERNEWLRPRQYGYVGSRIIDFAERAARQNISVGFDCGFVPCMFGEQGLGRLKRCDAELNWHCSPILDIDPTGRVLHCFPLAGAFSESLRKGLRAETVRSHFLARTQVLRQSGIYKKCSRCEFKLTEVCPGGCLAATMRRTGTMENSNGSA